MTITLQELRTAHAVGRFLLAGGRSPLPQWTAASVRRFAASLSGASYPNGKNGLSQAVAHIGTAVTMAEQAA